MSHSWRAVRKNETRDPTAHDRSMDRVRSTAGHHRPLLSLLVHVLAHRQRLSQTAAGRKQGGVSTSREARSAAGVAGVRRGRGRWLVPADTARCVAWLDKEWRLRRVDQAPVWSLS